MVLKHDNRRFYYDTEYKICEKFKYSGCGGNPNNFKSKEECKDHCPGKYIGLQKPLYCMNVPDRGECKNTNPRFYYTSERNICNTFWYSECGGNENRFEDI
ncbi:kunitz-type serine protease inhibitor 2-like [Danaus plexippus]|uniref:kunitz-type serine protease inhibitor 2-like n=1 Tax=Danaus plexippus TaxID=13037 RepID=UPI002AB0C117|nr:kunitz-type serine protease inhibitor 2-like [Danaus plexippus]